MKPTVTAVVITKNEEAMIANCLATVAWCDEVLVVDNGSEDRTVDIAADRGARVIEIRTHSFAEQRNVAIREVRTDWILYIDADERIVPKLAKELQVHLETSTYQALSFPRQHMMYGQVVEHGGWTEMITRVFRKKSLKEWRGDVHESPVYEGAVATLHTPLLHLTHRSTVESLKKSLVWTPREARLLAEAGIAPVTFWTLCRKGGMEFLRRAVFKQGWRDGRVGLFEAVVQAMNRVLVYLQVWELQQKPSVPEQYQAIEREVASLWQHES